MTPLERAVGTPQDDAKSGLGTANITELLKNIYINYNRRYANVVLDAIYISTRPDASIDLTNDIEVLPSQFKPMLALTQSTTVQWPSVSGETIIIGLTQFPSGLATLQGRRADALGYMIYTSMSIAVITGLSSSRVYYIKFYDGAGNLITYLHLLRRSDASGREYFNAIPIDVTNFISYP